MKVKNDLTVPEKWSETSEIFFDTSNEGEKYLSWVINEVVTNSHDERNAFQTFFKHVLESPAYNIGEWILILLPSKLIEEVVFKYKGCVKISVDHFNGEDSEVDVPIDKFYFFVKLAAVFHARHVDPSFDPWDGIKKLDELQRKYEAQPFDEGEDFDGEDP